MHEFKDKIVKQQSAFEGEVNVQIHGMRLAVERSQTAEDMYMSHVRHLAEELKRVDFMVEGDKLENAKILKNANEMISQLTERINQSLKEIKEYEGRIKLNEEKFNVLKIDLENAKLSSKETEKHINAYLPIENFNMVTQTLHECLEGSQFNRLIKFEQMKYIELEKQVHLKQTQDLLKLNYEIPPIPDFVEEVQY